MCPICEFQVNEDHRTARRAWGLIHAPMRKIPASATGDACYHCFGVGNTIDECPECVGKAWSEEFLSGKIETEGAGPIDLIM